MQNLDDIRSIVTTVLDDMALELVELQLFGANKSTHLRIFVYEKGGVSIERCAEASRRIADLLDRKDIISTRYHLEVSSPGLDRPLKTIRDFERNLGEKVQIVIPVEGKEKKIIGHVTGVEQNSVALETEEETETKIEFNNIKSAKIVIEF